MSHVCGWLLPYLINSLWQVPLLCAAGWIAARMVRPLSPAAEHCVWVATCLLQCLIPACAFVLPGWFTWSRHAAMIDSSVSVTMAPGGVINSIHLSKHLLASLAVVYSVFIVYFAARLLWRTIGVFNLRRASQPFTLKDEAADYLALCMVHFGLGDVGVFTSASIFSPVSFGFLRRLVLLPAALSESFTYTDLRTILAHECAHIYRNDFLKNFLYELVLLPVSYHPLCRTARSRLTETRELVCDELAASITGRTDYAGSLLHLAGLLLQKTSTSTSPAIGIFDARIFERRIMLLTKKSPSISSWKRRSIASSCIAFCLFTCASAVALRIHVDPAPVDHDNAVAPDQPVKIAAGMMAGNKLTGANPVYPEAAKKKKIQGKVVLSAVINKEGKVEQVSQKSGPAELGPPSIEAVRTWTYKPYLLNGEHIAVQTIVNVTYSLER